MVGISVDSIARNAAMVEKLALPFPLLTDPDGSIMQAYGVWDGDRKIAIPSIFVLDRSDTIRYLYRGRDFADRPGDTPIFEALDDAGQAPSAALGETQIRVTLAQTQKPETERSAISLESLGPYLRGVYFATVAIKGRLAALGPGYREGVRDVGRFQEMMQGYDNALRETITMKQKVGS